MSSCGGAPWDQSLTWLCLLNCWVLWAWVFPGHVLQFSDQGQLSALPFGHYILGNCQSLVLPCQGRCHWLPLNQAEAGVFSSS